MSDENKPQSKYNFGNITAKNMNVGDGTTMNVNSSGPSRNPADEHEALTTIRNHITSLQEDDKTVRLKADFDSIVTELNKGDNAHPGFIAERIQNIKNMMPEIASLIIEVMVNPPSAFKAVAERVVKKMEEDD